MNHNVVHYKQLRSATFTLDTTSKTLYDLIESLNSGFKAEAKTLKTKLNAIRIYIHSGVVGMKFDGTMVSQTSFIGIAEEQQLLENADLTLMSIVGVGGAAEITIQIGTIG